MEPFPPEYPLHRSQIEDLRLAASKLLGVARRNFQAEMAWKYGVRTQFLKRMVEFAEQISKPIHLLYYTPYHSKYNPIERCWGILERHWNGAKLTDALTMMLWAESMTSERSSSHSQVESQDLSNRYFFDKKSYAPRHNARHGSITTHHR